MITELLFAGFGGQGIMTMGQAIAYAGMHEGKHVTWFPSYGPEMRGGTANCSVVIADEPIGSPLISEPDILVVMNRPSLDKFQKNLKKKGLLYYNASLINVKPGREDIESLPIRASQLAKELGNYKVANMIIIGALIEKTGIIKTETMFELFKKNFSGPKKDLLWVNELALQKGKELFHSSLV